MGASIVAPCTISTHVLLRHMVTQVMELIADTEKLGWF